jgi:hypothetical protein
VVVVAQSEPIEDAGAAPVAAPSVALKRRGLGGAPAAARWAGPREQLVRGGGRVVTGREGRPSTCTPCDVSVGDSVVRSWRQAAACRCGGGPATERVAPVWPDPPVPIHPLSRALLRQSLCLLGCDHFLHFSRAPKCERASKQECCFPLVLFPYFV